MACNDPAIARRFHLRQERVERPFPDMLKHTLLLGIALFLIAAPEPDAGDISELSAGFFAQGTHASLLADETIEP